MLCLSKTYEGSFKFFGLILQVFAYRMSILLLIIIQHTGHKFYSHLYSCTEEYAQKATLLIIHHLPSWMADAVF
jgi:hypothetical protein